MMTRGASTRLVLGRNADTRTDGSYGHGPLLVSQPDGQHATLLSHKLQRYEVVIYPLTLTLDDADSRGVRGLHTWAKAYDGCHLRTRLPTGSRERGRVTIRARARASRVPAGQASLELAPRKVCRAQKGCRRRNRKGNQAHMRSRIELWFCGFGVSHGIMRITRNLWTSAHRTATANGQCGRVGAPRLTAGATSAKQAVVATISRGPLTRWSEIGAMTSDTD